MRYQAPLTLEQSLQTIKQRYLESTGADLAATPTLFSTFFGAKDVVTRKKQLNVLTAAATLHDPLNTNDSREALFDKYRLMVAIAYLTQQAIIATNQVLPVCSELYKLLDEALGLEKNALDQPTINECMLTLKACPLSAINRCLRKLGEPELTQTEWRYYQTQAERYFKEADPEHSICADSLSYVGGLVLQPLGWGLGLAFGQTIGKAGASVPLKVAVTGLIGSTFYLFGPLAGGGVAAAAALAAPRHAEKAVEYAAAYGAAQVGSYAAKKIGSGVGWVVGRSLDIAASGVYTAWLTAQNYCRSSSTVNLNVKVGLDLVGKQLVAYSCHLSQEEFFEKIKVALADSTSSKEQDKPITTSAAAAPSHFPKKTITFSMSPVELELLPPLLEKLGDTYPSVPAESPAPTT